MDKQPAKAKYVEMESNTSPWTELYAAADDARMAQPATERPSEADRPTHDALAAIYDGDWEGVLFSYEQEENGR